MWDQIVSILPSVLERTGWVRARRLVPELNRLGYAVSRRGLNRVLHFQQVNLGITQDSDYRWGYSRVDGLIRSLLRRGAVEISSVLELPNSQVVYAVVNGENILHVGEGNPERLNALMRESNGQIRHQKSFIVAASNVIHGPHHRYFVLAVPNKTEGRKIEQELHRLYGETRVSGISSSNRAQIAREMLSQLFELKDIDSSHPLYVRLLTAAWDNGATMSSLFWRDETRDCAAALFDDYY